MWGSGPGLDHTMWWFANRQQRRTQSEHERRTFAARRTNERTSDWEHLVTLIDGNVGSPDTDTIDDTTATATATRTQRRRPPRPRSPTRQNRSPTPAAGARRRCRAACGSASAAERSSRSTSTRSSTPSPGASEGLLGVDPMRVATRTISALADGASTRELDDLSIRTAAGLIVEEPSYSKLAVAPARHGHRQGGPQPEHPVVRRVDHGRPRRRASSPTTCSPSSRPTPRKLNDAINSDRDRSLRVLRPAHRVRPLPAAPPRARARSSRRRSTSSCASPAACAERRPGDVERGRVLRPDVVARLPPVEPDAVQLRHLALADVELLPARLAARTASTPSTSATPTSPSCRSSPAASASPSTACAAKGSLIRGTNGLSNGIVPWLQARSTRRSPRSTRAAAARARRASTSRRGTPTSRSSSSCATTPATTPAARTTSTSPTGSPTCSWSGSRRTGSGRCSIPKRVPHLTDLYGDEFERAYLDAEEAGLYEKQVPARQLYAQMMRTLAQTGNGWMTFKDASNEKCNQTGALNDDGTPRRAPLEPVHRDPRGHRPGRDRGLQPRLAQPRRVRRA